MVSLADALANVELEAGKQYRFTVRGRTVELRVLDDDWPDPELANQVMLEPWVELPFRPKGTVVARPGNIRLPDPPVIPDFDDPQP